MKKPARPPTELLTRLLPIDRLDEEGLALYRSVVSSGDERAFRSGAVRLMDRLCELGYMRMLSRTEDQGAVRLTYRNLLTLDTVSISVEQPTPEQAEQPASDAGARPGPPESETSGGDEPPRRRRVAVID